MKCIQRLCQRNKNLKSSGYCSICDDLIEDLKKKHEDAEKKRCFNRVDLDFNLLKETQEKLMNGGKVESNVVNILLLSGITNILSQSEIFDDTMEKVKVLERENMSNKMRIESLETWVLKLNEKVETVDTAEQVAKQIDAIKEELASLKETSSTPHATVNLAKEISCKKCEKTFTRNSDFETHMVVTHAYEKTHSCETCGKKFFLAWRLKKHLSIHHEFAKPCKYFQEGKTCPFYEVGCKFSHEKVQKKDTETDSEETMNITNETIADLNAFIEDEVECQMCGCTFVDETELDWHLKANHS